MSKKTVEQILLLIRLCREFDREKNNDKQIDAFLNYVAHELELILGGYYE